MIGDTGPASTQPAAVGWHFLECGGSTPLWMFVSVKVPNFQSGVVPPHSKKDETTASACLAPAPARLLHLWRRRRLALELRDPVAQLGGALELEVRRRREHLAVQLLQILLRRVIFA